MTLRRAAAAIDTWTDKTCRWVIWLTLIMVLIGAFNAIARKASTSIGINLSSNAFLELQWYAFSIVFLIGGVYGLKTGAHVRVDVLYGRLSAKAKTWINLIGTLTFLIPFSLFCLWATWPMMIDSWKILEDSPDPGGLWRYPIKTVVFLSFISLLIQGIGELLKHVADLREEPLDEGGLS